MGDLGCKMNIHGLIEVPICVRSLLSHKKHHLSSQNIAEYRKRMDLIILDMKMNSVGLSEGFDICGRRAIVSRYPASHETCASMHIVAAIEPCIPLTIHPEGGPPKIFGKRLTDFL
jgi:hypothetical protein